MTPFGRDSASTQHDPKHGGSVTVVARDTRFVGEVSGGHAVRVEGNVKGTVDLRAPLEVAEGATVEAEVRASAVRVAGSVIGNITATELVELLAGAVVKGDITSPSLHVVEGARLEGKVQMRVEPAAEKTLTAVQAEPIKS